MVNGTENTKIEQLLSEILKWTKFIGAKEVRGTLESALDTEKKRLIYHLSDGNRSSAEIAGLSRTSDWTVRNYWASWGRRGIMESFKVRGGDRYKKAFEIEDFDIPVPGLPTEADAGITVGGR